MFSLFSNGYSKLLKDCSKFRWNDKFEDFNRNFSEPLENEKHENENNLLISENLTLSLNSMKTRRNSNVAVIYGENYDGAKNFMVKNILQGKHNIVVFDKKQEILNITGDYLKEKGYHIDKIDTEDVLNSTSYDLFKHILSDTDIKDFVECITNNEKQDNEINIFKRYEKTVLYTALFYMKKHLSKDKHNITTLYSILEKMVSKDENVIPEFKVLLEKTNDVALNKEFLDFDLNLKTSVKKSVLMGVYVKLNAVFTENIKMLTMSDNINFFNNDNNKKALFISLPENNEKSNPIISIICSQLFNNITKTSGDIFTRIFINEINSVGYIPELAIKLTKTRQNNISCAILMKHLSYLHEIYDYGYLDVLENCDSVLCTAPQEQETVNFITNIMFNEIVKGQNVGGRTNPSLIFMEKLKEIKENECIVIIKGEKPFKDTLISMYE